MNRLLLAPMADVELGEQPFLASGLADRLEADRNELADTPVKQLRAVRHTRAAPRRPATRRAA